MEVFLLDKNLKNISVYDKIARLEVTDRYFAPGSISMTLSGANTLPSGAKYIYDSTSGRCAVIEENVRRGGITEISGRTLESLLERRVIYGEHVYDGDVESSVRRVISVNTASARAIPYFTLGALCGLSESAVLSASWNVLSDWCYSVLKPYGASYRINLDKTDSKLTFTVVQGVDRTRDQSVRLPVIFSEDIGTVLDSEYELSDVGYANTAYVCGSDGTVVSLTSDEFTGFDRREIFISAKDINPVSYETTELYKESLLTRGAEKLSKYEKTVRVDGTTAAGEYIYGIHYELGDLCEAVLHDGTSCNVRVTSVTRTYENGSVTSVPRFGADEMSLAEMISRETEKYMR